MWNKFVEAGCVKPIDLQLAAELFCDASLPIQAALIHLSIAIRQGHLCISSQMPIRPIWELVEPEEGKSTLSESDWVEVEALVKTGLSCLPESLIQTPSPSAPLNLNPLVILGDRIYTQRSWIAETRFRKHLNDFLETSSAVAISPEELDAKITHYGLQNRLLPEQKSAILNATGALSLIAGGPGTGKTYTAGWMITILSEVMQEKLNRPPVIALAAPTGKAALHLEASVQRSHDSALKLCSATTLHALLSKTPLIADLIVVDEASMIDLEWMNKLLKAIPTGARLILMGDPFQLPPVGMGSIFVDMIQTMPHTHLQKCLRTELQSIVTFAASIKEGVYHPWEKTFALEDQASFVRYCAAQYQNCKTMQDFARFKVLSPFTKGPFGTEQLNKKIREALGHADVVPILVTKNDYDLDLFNGEVGLWLVAKNVAQFPKRGGEGTREIPLSLISSYQLGYCLTIHKSQGSEYPHVAIVYPEGAQIFGREALYTAVTRAKEELEIFSSQATLEQAVARTNRRFSGIVNFI
jgi:exodeoxyribonuclease V alpha subunit